MRVALATDHAGFPLKQPIADWLTAAGHHGGAGTPAGWPRSARWSSRAKREVVQGERLRVRGGRSPVSGQAADLEFRRDGRRLVKPTDRLAYAQVAGDHPRGAKGPGEKPFRAPAADAAPAGQGGEPLLVCQGGDVG